MLGRSSGDRDRQPPPRRNPRLTLPDLQGVALGRMSRDERSAPQKAPLRRQFYSKVQKLTRARGLVSACWPKPDTLDPAHGCSEDALQARASGCQRLLLQLAVHPPPWLSSSGWPPGLLRGLKLGCLAPTRATECTKQPSSPSSAAHGCKQQN